jgi:hypothetical protein
VVDILAPKISAPIGFTTIHGAEMVCRGCAGQTADHRNPSKESKMKSRNLMATSFVAALAGLCQPAAQAAPSGGSDLRGVTQNWDETLSAEPGGPCPAASARFTCVMNNAAVRDNETGLVWAQPQPTLHNWYVARSACANDTTGARKGWRLPTVSELASLVDPLNAYTIKLPPGHPFVYVASYYGYWSATPDANDEQASNVYGAVWVVRFQYSAIAEGAAGTVARMPKNSTGATWCVRGGQSLGGTY